MQSVTLTTQRVNKLWRIAATGLGFMLFGLSSLLLGLALLVVLLPLPLSRQRKQRITRSSVCKFAKGYLATLQWLGLFTYDISINTDTAIGGQLFIANHPTLLDAIFLLAVLPNCNCVIKGALVANPFVRTLIRLGGYIPNRNDGIELLYRAVETLQRGENLIIFPEGTRTRDEHTLRFKRGAANIALRAKCPVHPLVINCQPLFLRKGQAWHQVPETPPHYDLHALKSEDITQCIDTDKPEGVRARHLTKCWLSLYARELHSQN